MIEAGKPPPKNTMGNLKNDTLFLLNDEIQSNHDDQNEKIRLIENMKNCP